MGLWRAVIATMNVMGPTRPRNMMTATKTFPKGESSGVTLRERPVVPKAEGTSQREGGAARDARDAHDDGHEDLPEGGECRGHVKGEAGRAEGRGDLEEGRQEREAVGDHDRQGAEDYQHGGEREDGERLGDQRPRQLAPEERDPVLAPHLRQDYEEDEGYGGHLHPAAGGGRGRSYEQEQRLNAADR